jgi:purine-binding chemotaxis protein CheW
MSIEQAAQNEFLINEDGSEEDTGTENQYLTFGIAGQKFGVSVADTVQILGIQDITPVPDYPAYAKGIIKLRDMVIPVLDLRARFHKEPRPYDSRTCIIITKILDTPFGLIADGVDSVVDIAPDQLLPAPQVTFGDQEYAYLTGVAKLDQDLILVMDTKKLISDKVAEEILKKLSSSEQKG